MQLCLTLQSMPVTQKLLWLCSALVLLGTWHAAAADQSPFISREEVRSSCKALWARPGLQELSSLSRTWCLASHRSASCRS